MNDQTNHQAELYDIGVSSGLIRRWAENLPRRPHNAAEVFSSFQVELPSRRWLKMAASKEGWN